MAEDRKKTTGIKLGIKYVKEYFAEYKYCLISVIYKNNQKKLNVLCPNGHFIKVTFGNFSQGHRCRQCGIEERHYNLVTKLKNEGYKVLTESIVKSNEKLEIVCPNGHIFKTIGSELHRGARCRQCVFENLRIGYKHVKKTIEQRGYKLLSKEYENANIPIKIKCPKGHVYQTIFNGFNRRGCQKCYLKNNVGSKASNWQGGLSKITPYFRDCIKQWIKDSLKHYSNQCFITKKENNLEVHHPINFNNILKESFKILHIKIEFTIKNYNDFELNKIKNKLLELHYKYGYGIPLHRDIHKLFHRIYGAHNNSWEQLSEFKESYNLKLVSNGN